MLNGKKIAALCIPRANNERHMEFIGHLNSALVEQDYRIVIYHTCTDFFYDFANDLSEKHVFELMDYSVIDVVIVYDESYHDKSVPRGIADTAKEHGVPVISVGRLYEDCISFVYDYAKGFENVVRHVIECHNAKDICMIAGVKGEITSEERIEILSRLMDEYKLEKRENWLYYGDYWWGPAQTAAREIIASGNIPDAIVCANDAMAITVCEEFRKNGYSVPEDLIITGFDGTKEAAYCNPVLTTSGCNIKGAVDGIVEAILSPDINSLMGTAHYIPYSIIIEESCGCRTGKRNDNMGEALKYIGDVYTKYQNDQRILFELSEELMACSTPTEFVQRMGKSQFYFFSLMVNGDCLDERINPAEAHRDKPFDDVMQALFVADKDNSRFPEPCPKKDIMPDIEDAFETKMPLVISVLSSMAKPIGYLCLCYEIRAEIYSLIPQFVIAFSNAVSSFRSMRHLRHVAESMRNVSRCDYMTDMLNRTGFYAEMPELVKSCGDEKILIATIDIDGLKHINDEYGHESGDIAITTVCDVVKELPFERKVCARFGGDELVVCALSPGDNGAELMKSALCDKLAEMNEKLCKPFRISASIGVCTSEKKNFNFEAALKDSDEKMYIMKIGRPNRRKS